LLNIKDWAPYHNFHYQFENPNVLKHINNHKIIQQTKVSWK